MHIGVALHAYTAQRLRTVTCNRYNAQMHIAVALHAYTAQMLRTVT